MEFSKPKSFEKPKEGGPVVGTIVDVVDMPNVQTQYGLKNKVRIMWVIGTLQGQPILDTEGKPMTVAEFYTAILAENSNLSKALIQILNAQPPLMNSTEQMAQLLIGRSSNLFLTKTPNPKKLDAQGNPDYYINIAGHSPLTPGQVAPSGQGYVREINRPKTVGGQQTYATPQAAQQAQQQPGQQPSFQQPQNGYVAPQNTQATLPPNTRAF